MKRETGRPPPPEVENENEEELPPPPDIREVQSKFDHIPNINIGKFSYRPEKKEKYKSDENFPTTDQNIDYDEVLKKQKRKAKGGGWGKGDARSKKKKVKKESFLDKVNKLTKDKNKKKK